MQYTYFIKNTYLYKLTNKIKKLSNNLLANYNAVCFTRTKSSYGLA